MGLTPVGDGREGKGGKQNRKREKVGCNPVTIKASADPQGKLKLGWPCRVTPS